MSVWSGVVTPISPMAICNNPFKEIKIILYYIMSVWYIWRTASAIQTVDSLAKNCSFSLIMLSTNKLVLLLC